jgi:hypothetical protein
MPPLKEDELAGGDDNDEAGYIYEYAASGSLFQPEDMVSKEEESVTYNYLGRTVHLPPSPVKRPQQLQHNVYLKWGILFHSLGGHCRFKGHCPFRGISGYGNLPGNLPGTLPG